jgi:hypothetical protein
MTTKMKNLICVLMAVVLVSGCTTTTYESENDARQKLTSQMTPQWLKSHIVVGKTTQPQVRQFFGDPLFKNLSLGSVEDTNAVPLEKWTYQGAWDKTIKQPLKFVVFSFTNDIVSTYRVSQNEY